MAQKITLEALQALKFIYWQDCLDFAEDMVTCERGYAVSGPVTSRAVNTLIAAGNLRELGESLQNASDIHCNYLLVIYWLQIMRQRAEPLASHYLDYQSVSLPNLFPHHEVNKVELSCRFTRISHLGSIQLLDAATLVRLEVRPKLLPKSVAVKDVVPESISQKHVFELSLQHIILVVILVYLCRSSTVLTYLLIRNGNGHSTVTRSYTTEMLQILEIISAMKGSLSILRRLDSSKLTLLIAGAKIPTVTELDSIDQMEDLGLVLPSASWICPVCVC
jgi:hypothetical protein